MTIAYVPPSDPHITNLSKDEVGRYMRLAFDQAPDWKDLFDAYESRKAIHDSVDTLLNLTESDPAFCHEDFASKESSHPDLHLALDALFGKPFALNKDEVNAWCQSETLIANVSPSFNIGLVQLMNGPCGVLVALQCWMITYTMLNSYHDCMLGANQTEQSPQNFSPNRQAHERNISNYRPLHLPSNKQFNALAWAICICLYRCTKHSTYYLIKTKLPSFDSAPTNGSDLLADAEVSVAKYDRISPIFWQLLHDLSKNQPVSLLGFLLSVLLTRGSQNTKNDMDDPSCPLIAKHGHSSQELVNLLLTGEASSNVFDEDRLIGQFEPHRLKGIHRKQIIGYLTRLETYGYCEVGHYYKSPLLPVWVIGSMNHFTASFALDARITIETIFERKAKSTKRIFDIYDPEGSGMIFASVLLSLLERCGLKDHYLEARKLLDPPGQGGMIIRHDFLEWASSKLRREAQPSNPLPLPKKFLMYHYDGQVPGGPELLAFIVEVLDFPGTGDTSDLRNAELEAILTAKWNNVAVYIATNLP